MGGDPILRLIRWAVDRVPRSFQRILITGVRGSGGSYFAEHVARVAPKAELHGISRWHSTGRARNLAAVVGQVKVHECDLIDMSSVLRVLERVQPDLVVHMASMANVQASFATPLSVVHNNVMGTANLLEAIRMTGFDPLMLLCSTCEVYGSVAPERIPITEDCPFHPANPYAISKAAQDHLGLTWWEAYGIRIVRTRMFNYINPRRSDLFATAFALQMARIEAGLQTVLLHGNLASVRSLIDIRDAMDAYWQAALYCEPGQAYNMGGSTVMSVGDFLELLKSRSSHQIPCQEDPSLLRPTDVATQVPDTTRFTAATGWAPRYPFEETVDHLLTHVRREVEVELIRDDQDQRDASTSPVQAARPVSSEG